MPSPILARADALMQRRRHPSEVDDIPVLTDAVSIEDDIPVLVDVVDPVPVVERGDDLATESLVERNQAIPELVVSKPAISEPAVFEPVVSDNADFDTAVFDNAVSETSIRDTLARELAHRVQERITAELPRIIESTLRDFLAEQEKISALTSRD